MPDPTPPPPGPDLAEAERLRAARQVRRDLEWAKRDEEAAEAARQDKRINQAAAAAVEALPNGVGVAVATLLEAMKPWRAPDGYMSYSAIGRSSPEVLALAEALLAASPSPRPLPEPDGAELAEAERYFRQLARSWKEHGARSDADLLVTLMAEYNRRPTAEAYDAACAGLMLRDKALAAARAELAALREAATALVEHYWTLPSSHRDWIYQAEAETSELLDALADVVRGERG